MTTRSKLQLITVIIISTYVFLGAAKAAHEYELRVTDKDRNVTMVRYFSTFESCRTAREIALAAFEESGFKMYTTCSPSEN